MSVLDDYDALLLDLDGVVYRGAGAVPFAVEVLNEAKDRSVRLGFVTNNASRPVQEVADHLNRIGIGCLPEQVVTSAQVGADLLSERVAEGSPVLSVGGSGVALALRERGFLPVIVGEERARGRSDGEIADSVRGVLQGFGPDVTWRDLAVASYAVARGAAWVATNNDWTIPRADGMAPGNGTLVAAVTAATGLTPPAAGKPAAAMMRIAAARLGAQRALAIGDRLDTDIRGAAAAGIDSLLVLTGVSGPQELVSAPPSDQPTFAASDLRGLLRDLPRLDRDLPDDAASVDHAVAAEVRQCWLDAARDRGGAAARISALLAA